MTHNLFKATFFSVQAPFMEQKSWLNSCTLVHLSPFIMYDNFSESISASSEERERMTDRERGRRD